MEELKRITGKCKSCFSCLHCMPHLANYTSAVPRKAKNCPLSILEQNIKFKEVFYSLGQNKILIEGTINIL
jgi:hypothetical protein